MQNALDYLYGFIDHNLSRQERYAARQMSLDRTRNLMNLLGNPQNTYPIIHLTGTKGKGSVGAMLASVLRQANYRVGLYSSPHLQDFRERFRVNNDLISSQALCDIVDELRPHADRVPGLTWFEVVTALGFEFFRRQSVDIAVVEVGLGGRLDATNIVCPLLSIITSLSLDHISILGETLPDIAREKAGIIKPHTPVISAPQAPEALAVIQETAAQQDAPLILVGRDWQFVSHGGSLATEEWEAGPAESPLQSYQTVLLGQHQAINATVALAAMHQLHTLGIAVPETAIRTGLMRVNWAGRLEIVKQAPTVVLDAAHNAASARWLARTVSTRFEEYPKVFVFGAKSDKDIDGMFGALLPIVDHLILTKAIDPRAESPYDLVQRARDHGYERKIDVVPAAPDALLHAETLAGRNGLVCVTGSMYLVGEARTIYELSAGEMVRQELES